MAFLKNIFKQVSKEKKSEQSDSPVFEEREQEKVSAPGFSSVSGVRRGVLVSPRITEKSADSSKTGIYTFVVAPWVTKHEARRLIEARYGVHIERVRVVRLPGKRRRRGNQVGMKPGIKKMIVSVQKGQHIEIQ